MMLTRQSRDSCLPAIVSDTHPATPCAYAGSFYVHFSQKAGNNLKTFPWINGLRPSSQTPSKEDDVVRITNVDFVELTASEAQCLLTCDDGVVSIKCVSLLPKEAETHQHRIAWLQDALRQLRRMPEYRAAAAESLFSDIVLSAASAMRRRTAVS